MSAVVLSLTRDQGAINAVLFLPHPSCQQLSFAQPVAHTLHVRQQPASNVHRIQFDTTTLHTAPDRIQRKHHF